MSSIHLQFLILTKKTNWVFIGGVFLDIDQKNNLFLFDSFGLEGFKLFIVNNDQQIINQLLYNFGKCKIKSNEKLTLYSMKFCVDTWEKMLQKTKSQLTETAQNFFHLLEQFAKLKVTA